MINSDDIRIFETSLIPYFCDMKTAEQFISALQYKDFLDQEMAKTDAEIKELCMSIEKQISFCLPH